MDEARVATMACVASLQRHGPADMCGPARTERNMTISAGCRRKASMSSHYFSKFDKLFEVFTVQAYIGLILANPSKGGDAKPPV